MKKNKIGTHGAVALALVIPVWGCGDSKHGQSSTEDQVEAQRQVAGNSGAVAAPAGGGGSPSASPGSGEASGNRGATGAAGPNSAVQAPTSYKTSVHVPQVAAGVEGTVCGQVRLDNTTPINVVSWHNTLSKGSHHFVVAKVSDPQGKEKPFQQCQAFGGALDGNEMLGLTQKHDDQLTLPMGVAYNFAASQLLYLEMHYMNTTDGTLDITANTELFAAAADAKVQEASMLIIGTADINIPARSTASTGTRYAPLPEGVEGVQFFAITGHTHRMGTSVKVELATGPSQTEKLLYAPQPFNWDAPETINFDPAFVVPSGGGFNFECTWDNASDKQLAYGESALDEMCFFWAYYYPKKPVENLIIL